MITDAHRHPSATGHPPPDFGLFHTLEGRGLPKPVEHIVSATIANTLPPFC
jgi:hypothetical protein